MDNPISRAQGDAATGHDEIRQRVLRVDVDRLGISRGVTKGLHCQVGRKAQAG